MEKARKNNSNIMKINRSLNRHIQTTLVVSVILVITLITQNMSVFASIPAKYKIRNYTYEQTNPEWNKDEKTFTMYTGSDGNDEPTYWGINVADLSKIDGYTQSNSGFYYHELKDIHTYCAYASIADNVNTKNSLATSFCWAPSKLTKKREDGTSILKQMVYMKLYDLRGKTGRPLSDLDAVCFGGDNPNVSYTCYELNENGKILSSEEEEWKPTKAGYELKKNRETRYLLFQFKIEGHNGSTIDIVPEMINQGMEEKKYINGVKYNSFLILRPFKITLDKDGGIGGMEALYEAYDTEWYTSPKMTYDSIVSAITSDDDTKIYHITSLPEKTGYTFGGYYTEKDGKGTQYIDARGKFVYEKMKNREINENKTLYAYWIPNTYDISYKLNSGSWESNASYPSTATYNKAFTVNTPTRNGYTFAGWKITGMDDCEHIRIVDGEEMKWSEKEWPTTSYDGCTTATVYQNLRAKSGTVTFEAQWEPKKLEIIFYSDVIPAESKETTVKTYYHSAAEEYEKDDTAFYDAEQWAYLMDGYCPSHWIVQGVSEGGNSTSFSLENKVDDEFIEKYCGKILKAFLVWEKEEPEPENPELETPEPEEPEEPEQEKPEPETPEEPEEPEQETPEEPENPEPETPEVPEKPEQEKPEQEKPEPETPEPEKPKPETPKSEKPNQETLKQELGTVKVKCSSKNTSVKLSKSTFIYTGKENIPSITVTYKSKNKTIRLKKNTDYTLKYTNNKKIGMGKVTVNFKGAYSGSIQKTFTIKPDAPKGLTLKKAAPGIKLNWKKVKGASGYTVYRSIKGKAYKKIATIKGNKSTYTDKISLKKNTAYKYKIAAYTKTNGKTIKSKNSPCKIYK